MDKVTVIIPAAGLGTRMRPLSNGLSKTLISLNGIPILSWILNTLTNYYDGRVIDIEQIIIVTNNSGDIRRFVNTVYQGTPVYDKIKTVVQDQSDYPGPGGAIITAARYLEIGTNILVWLGDTVCLDPNYDFKDSFLAVCQVPSSTAPRWCIPYINSEENVIQFYNKPDASAYADKETVDALIGIYYMKNFNIDVCRFIGYKTEIEISSVILDWYKKTNLPIKLVYSNNYWYDCGELDSFYDSKAKLLNHFCRVQSGLKADPEIGAVTKYSNIDTGISKLQDEYKWFAKRHGKQLLFLPKVIDHTESSYTMDIAPGTTLADILIYENVPKKVFASLIKHAVDIYHKHFVNYFDSIEARNAFVDRFADKAKIYSNLVNGFYKERMLHRLFKNEAIYKNLVPECDICETSRFINNMCKSLIQQYNSALYLPHNMIKTNRGCDIHGDFHLGNILFDSMTGKYTFLDPRGGEMYNDYADTYYDMAKIYHDIYCGYLLIVKGIYSIKNDQVVFSDYYQEYFDFLVKTLDNYLKTQYNYNCELIKKLAIAQMLTCIPFHLDQLERCKGFLLRALNLINIQKKE